MVGNYRFRQPSNIAQSTQNAQPQSYEMRNLNNTAPAQQSAYVQPLNQRDYLEQVDLVRNLLKETDTSLQEVATLHNRLLSADDTSADTEAGSRLQNIESETMSRNNQIRRFIQRLAQDAANTTDNTKDMKNRQVGPLRREFQNKLTAYQGLERDYRTARQEQIRRQYMIVNPDATDGELAAVADASTDSHSQGVFQMAVSI